jgi:predicted dehydrogenase
MVEQATHLVDLSRLFLGEAAVVAAQADRHPRSAYPDADVADTTAALLLYGEGVSGVFTATCLLAGPSAIRLRLVCEGVIITVTQEAVVYDTGCDSRTIPTGNDPFAAEDRAFLAAVRQRDPRLLFSSYEDALHTHRLCCAIRHAAGDDRSSG